MALSAQNMKQDIITALASGADTAANANKKFGDAILKTICDTITIVYAWAAANPASGAPDPVVTFSATVSGGGTLTPSAAFPEMLVKLAALIKGLTISAPAGFVVAPLAFNSAVAYILSSINVTVSSDPRVVSVDSIQFNGQGDSLMVTVHYTDINNAGGSVTGSV